MGMSSCVRKVQRGFPVSYISTCLLVDYGGCENVTLFGRIAEYRKYACGLLLGLRDDDLIP